MLLPALEATHWARGDGKASSPVYKLQVTCLSVYKSDSWLFQQASVPND